MVGPDPGVERLRTPHQVITYALAGQTKVKVEQATGKGASGLAAVL